MLNRWQGNTGRVEKIDDLSFRPSPPPVVHSEPKPVPPPVRSGQNGLLENIGKILPGMSEPLETEDLILLLILYLMYRESRDSELLIIMGAMFLL